MSTPLPVDRSVWVIYFKWHFTPWGPGAHWQGWTGQAHWSSRNQRYQYAARTTDPDRYSGIGRRDLVTSHYPMPGPYDQLSEETLRHHLGMIRAAGIDGLLISYYGPDAWIGKDGVNDVIVDKIVRLAPGYDLRVGLLLDGWPTMETDLKAYAERLLPFWERFRENPTCLVEDGRIPVQLWAFNVNLRYEGSKIFLDHCQRMGIRLYGITGCPTSPAEDPVRYMSLFDASGTYGGEDDCGTVNVVRFCREAGRKVFLNVQAGGDVTGGEVRDKHPYPNIRRHKGRHYLHRWRLASELGADAVLITSWNEWFEGTEIEPSREYGFHYVRMTKYLSRLFKEGRWSEYDDAEMEAALNWTPEQVLSAMR